MSEKKLKTQCAIVSSSLLQKYKRWDAGFYLGQVNKSYKKANADDLTARKAALLKRAKDLAEAEKELAKDQAEITARQKEWTESGQIQYLDPD